jgi:hypothetical protein
MKTKLIFAALTFWLPVCAASAELPNLPELKEGLWSFHSVTTTNLGDKVENNVKLCHDHAFDKHVRELSNKIACVKISESNSGGKYSFEQRCTIGKYVMQSKSTTIVQGDTVHGESHTTTTPAMGGESETTVISDSQYIGSCPAGVLPGDTIRADGTVTHGRKY